MATRIFITYLGACSFIWVIHLSVIGKGRGTDVVEGFWVGDRVAEDYPMCPLIISLRDIPIPFLPRRVPDLELQPMVIDSKRLDLEVDSDGGDVVLLELVVAESYQDVGLAHPAVSNDY